jgi:hypothetical protein
MCFSANASFVTAAGLSIISLLSLRKTRTKKMIPLAISPFFFALQQSCEGIVWLTLSAGDTTSMLHKMGMYGFLFFAAFWWPIWIPLALYISEKVHSRKKLLLATTSIGLCSGILLFISWVFYTTGAIIINHHIDYPVSNYPFGITNTFIAQSISWTIAMAYCIATITPFFISSLPYAWLLGITISLGLITSYLFYLMAFPSVWCFFAAISSVLTYFVIKAKTKK